MVLESQPLRFPYHQFSSNNVLIVFGTGDEALYYQAELGSFYGSSSFIVYFHEKSQILERVRLYGSLNVQVIASDEFFASLHLLNNGFQSLPDRVGLELRLQGCVLDESEKPYFFNPLT